MPTFKVLRRLDGDRLYEPGDTREMSEADAKGLVASGALEPMSGGEKAQRGEKPADDRASEAGAGQDAESDAVFSVDDADVGRAETRRIAPDEQPKRRGGRKPRQ